MSVYEIPVPRRRRRMVRIETTEEFITGFFCDDCQRWSPERFHMCLARLRTQAK